MTLTAEKSLECFKALKTVHWAYDLAADQLSQRLGVPLCVEKCGLCCKNCVFCYGIEAAYAVSNLVGDGNLNQILDRVEDWLLENHKVAPTHTPVFGGESIVINEQLDAEINRLARSWCPFLDEDKRCLIHPYRPLVCRAFGVTRTVHRDCQRPCGKGESLNKQAYFGGLGAAEIKSVLDELVKKDPNPIGAKTGFFPSLILAIAQPARYRKLAMSGKVATAKLLLTDESRALLWQRQLERMRQPAIVSA